VATVASEDFAVLCPGSSSGTIGESQSHPKECIRFFHKSDSDIWQLKLRTVASHGIESWASVGPFDKFTLMSE